MRKRLKRAVDMPDYTDAKAALLRIARELEQVNASAARSLLEGLKEMLTLQRLGLADELGRSFKTTNVIESVNAGVGQRTDKVDHWRNSNQIQRWVAAAALAVESRCGRCAAAGISPSSRTLRTEVSNDAAGFSREPLPIQVLDH